MNTPMVPTAIDVFIAAKVREKISLPVLSVPNRCNCPLIGAKQVGVHL